MGIWQMGMPQDLALYLQGLMQIDTFVETGTFHGDTSSWAAGCFSRVISIELSRELHARAVEKLADKGIEFLHGDSAELLPAVCGRLDTPAMFWLDAHFCAGPSAGSGQPNPLLREVESIIRIQPGACILVDDARLVLMPPPLPHAIDEYPELWELLLALNPAGSRYVFHYADVFGSVPRHFAGTLKGWLQGRATEADRAHWDEARKNDWIRALDYFGKGFKALARQAGLSLSGKRSGG